MIPWTLRAATPSGTPARAGLSFLPAFEEQPDQRYQLLLLPGEEVIGREHHGLARAAHALEHCGALGRALQHGVEVGFRVDVENRKLKPLDRRDLPVPDGKR